MQLKSALTLRSADWPSGRMEFTVHCALFSSYDLWSYNLHTLQLGHLMPNLWVLVHSIAQLAPQSMPPLTF